VIELWYQRHSHDTEAEQTSVTIHSDINRPHRVLNDQLNPFNAVGSIPWWHLQLKRLDPWQRGARNSTELFLPARPDAILNSLGPY
jgi:hypothetical protein